MRDYSNEAIVPVYMESPVTIPISHARLFSEAMLEFSIVMDVADFIHRY
jgi:hypothetical protein